MGQQFVTIGARHFEVGHDQVAAGLGDDLQRLQAIGGQPYAITGFFEHPADKLAHTDRVIDQNHNFFIRHGIDRFVRDRSASHSLSAGSENPGSIGAGHQRAMLDGFSNNQAVYIDQKDQAAIGSNGRAGKHLDVAEIFTQALDHDFIFADHLFDYDANLPASHVHDHHAEEPIDRLDRFKPQDSVEPHDFGDNVANFCKLFAADLFDLVGLQAANLLHESQRHCEHVFATADEERLRDDEGQRHFQSKARAPALFGVHLDLAIQLHHVRTHYVEAHTASGQFALAGSSREAGMEKEVQQVLLAQIGCS